MLPLSFATQTQLKASKASYNGRWPLYCLYGIRETSVLSISKSQTWTRPLWQDLSHIINRESLQGHTRRVTCLDVGAGLLLSGSEDSSLRVWSLQTGAPLSVLALQYQVRVETAEVRQSYRDTVIARRRQKESIMGEIIILLTPPTMIDPVPAWKPSLCHKDTAEGKKCP